MCANLLTDNIPEAWRDFVPSLKAGKHLPLLQEISKLREAGKVIFPAQDDIFRALCLTLPQDVRVIILGQDPYHGQGQAQGLAFSVPTSVKIPPSLRNIFKEIQRDIYSNSDTYTGDSDLSRLSKQGVLLLNTVLSVEEGKAHSHAHLGWQAITHDILQSLAKQHPLAVLLWGKPAEAYAPIFTEQSKHLVLSAPHPSPLSAHRGFLGCGHFSMVNSWLSSQGHSPIIW